MKAAPRTFSKTTAITRETTGGICKSALRKSVFTVMVLQPIAPGKQPHSTAERDHVVDDVQPEANKISAIPAQSSSTNGMSTLALGMLKAHRQYRFLLIAQPTDHVNMKTRALEPQLCLGAR